MTTPIPRPAALVIEAMAVTACEVFAPGISITDQRCIDMMRDAIEAALRTAASHGLVLIPRAELEAAAEAAEDMEVHWAEKPLARAAWHDLASKLRQRSRG